MGRICIVSAFDPLPGDNRPLIRYPVLANYLLEAGHQVQYLTTDFDHFEKKHRKAHPPVGFELFQIPVPGYKHNVSIGRLWSHRTFAQGVIRKLGTSQKPPDLILSAYPPILANARLGNWAKKRDCLFWLDVQDDWPEAFLASLSNLPFARLPLSPLYRLQKKSVQQAHVISAVSRDYLESLKDRFGKNILPDSQLVFPLGQPVPEPLEKEALPLFPDHPSRAVAVYVGTSSQIPIIEDILQDPDSVPDRLGIILVLAHPRFARWKALKHPKVKVTGFQDTQALRQILHQSDIGLMLADPLLQTRLPNKVQLYWMHGLHVLNNLPGGELADILADSDSGMTFSGGKDELWNVFGAIQDQLSTDSRNRIKKWANGLFSQEVIYQGFAQKISDLIAKKPK